MEEDNQNNPRAIYEEMLKDERFKDYRFIWFIKHHKKKNIVIPKAEIKEYLINHIFIICHVQNIRLLIVRCLMYIRKKDEQEFIFKHGMEHL